MFDIDLVGQCVDLLLIVIDFGKIHPVRKVTILSYNPVNMP